VSSLSKKFYKGLLQSCEQYGVSKLAVQTFAQLLDKKVYSKGVFVNTVRPGNLSFFLDCLKKNI
jgi:hypothetical protein